MRHLSLSLSLRCPIVTCANRDRQSGGGGGGGRVERWIGRSKYRASPKARGPVFTRSEENGTQCSIWSVMVFCNVFMKCSHGCWAGALAAVQPIASFSIYDAASA